MISNDFFFKMWWFSDGNPTRQALAWPFCGLAQEPAASWLHVADFNGWRMGKGLWRDYTSEGSIYRGIYYVFSIHWMVLFLMGEKYWTVLKCYARDPQDCSYLGLFRSGFWKSPTLVLHFPPFAFGWQLVLRKLMDVFKWFCTKHGQNWSYKAFAPRLRHTWGCSFIYKML